MNADGLPGVGARLFLGKGGVGKTTCAAATALRFAEAGERTLVLSTDPAPSLSHIFERTRSEPGGEVAERLFLAELGSEEVRSMWDERFGREVYAVFSAFVDVDYVTFVEFMTSVLPGLGEEFMVDYVRRLASEGRYRRIVWDTAPLGQTLALLGTPSLLARHLKMAPRIYSHLRASGERRESMMDVLRRWESLSALCMEFLRREVRFAMVTIPEALASCQLEEAFRQLERYGLTVERLIVNNVIGDPDSPFLERKAAEQQEHLRRLRQRYGHLPITEIPLFPNEVRGLERLRQVAAVLGPGLPEPAAGGWIAPPVTPP